MEKVWIAGAYLAALLSVMSPLQGCGSTKDCPQNSCLKAVRLTFEPALQQEGSYLFTFHLPSEGEIISCATTLPRPNTQGLSCSSSISGPDLGLAQLVLQETGDVIEGIRFLRSPRELELEISFDGEVISRTVHKPAYPGVPRDEVCACVPGASETLKL